MIKLIYENKEYELIQVPDSKFMLAFEKGNDDWRKFPLSSTYVANKGNYMEVTFNSVRCDDKFYGIKPLSKNLNY